MSAIEADDGLRLQLMEATQALFRAAIALESVEPMGPEQSGMRCPYLLPGAPLVLVSEGDAIRREGDTGAGNASGPDRGPVPLSPTPDLNSVIGAIDERSGYQSGHMDPNSGVRRKALVRGRASREITSSLRVARQDLRDALPRVADALARDRIGAAIGLLGSALAQLYEVAGLSEPEP